MRGFLRDITEMIFPANCEVCGRKLIDGESLLCLHCRYEMPLTNIHRSNWNTIHERLASPGLPIEKGASYFYYLKNSPYALLIQKGKYNGRPDIVRDLAREYAESIKGEGFFDGIDMMLPIPMHWLKQLRRGYNQAEEICRAVSQATGIPIGDNLRAKRHSTQTRKSAFQRHENMAGIIKVAYAEELQGKHILLVDDIITTGSTILSAIRAIKGSAPTARISVLTLGCTKLN